MSATDDPIAALQAAMYAVRFAEIVREESRRTVLCSPADAERIRRAVEERGAGDILAVIESPFVDPGQIYVVDEQGLDAANREAIARMRGDRAHFGDGKPRSDPCAMQVPDRRDTAARRRVHRGGLNVVSGRRRKIQRRHLRLWRYAHAIGCRRLRAADARWWELDPTTGIKVPHSYWSASLDFWGCLNTHLLRKDGRYWYLR